MLSKFIKNKVLYFNFTAIILTAIIGEKLLNSHKILNKTQNSDLQETAEKWGKNHEKSYLIPVSAYRVAPR
jgi:hypothetical protein